MKLAAAGSVQMSLASRYARAPVPSSAGASCFGMGRVISARGELRLMSCAAVRQAHPLSIFGGA